MHIHIIQRKHAKTLGMNRYFTGKPCQAGHVSERKISGSCLACGRTPEQYERNKAYISKFFERNPGRQKEYWDKYYSKPEARLVDSEKRKRYRVNNGSKVLANQSRYRRERYASSPEFKMSVKCRLMVRRVMQAKKSSTFEVIGYTPDKLMKRIEFQFRPGMSWDNYGDWEIDHKKPVARFISQGCSDPSIINALSNLQPLWKAENRAKGDKYGS